MKQTMRKEFYVCMALIIITLLMISLPIIKAQRLYEWKAVDHFFAEIAKDKNMETKDASFIRRCYQLSEENYLNVHVYGYKGTMDVAEIALFEVQEQQPDVILTACEKRIAALTQSFQGYGTTQIATLERSSIKQYGNIVICVITDDSDVLLTMLEQSL